MDSIVSDEELRAIFTEEQIEDLELVCDDPAFVRQAAIIKVVCTPERPWKEPWQVHKELKKARDAISKLSERAQFLLAIQHQDRDKLLRAFDGAMEDATCLVTPTTVARRDLGDNSLRLFKQFGIPATTQVDGFFVLFLTTVIEAIGTNWDARRLAIDTLP